MEKSAEKIVTPEKVQLTILMPTEVLDLIQAQVSHLRDFAGVKPNEIVICRDTFKKVYEFGFKMGAARAADTIRDLLIKL